jgi:hypothetical protein
MGKQIEFAQSEQDERHFKKMLTAKFELLALPRVLSSLNPTPMDLHSIQEPQVIMFGAQFLETVLNRINPIKGKSDLFQVFPRDNLCIEWDRSLSFEKGTSYGRCYLPNRQAEISEIEQFNDGVMRHITTYIKGTSPEISVLTPHVYLGEDLVMRIRKGVSDGVYYAGGSLMKTRANPLFRDK